jgi:hypothetical protein
MANKCECGKRISRGATHCGTCARAGGGYRSNMAAELAEQKRKDDAAKSLRAAAEAKASAKARERQKQIAARAQAAKERDQRKADLKRDRVKDLKMVRQLGNVRGKQEQPPKKKGWW